MLIFEWAHFYHDEESFDLCVARIGHGGDDPKSWIANAVRQDPWYNGMMQDLQSCYAAHAEHEAACLKDTFIIEQFALSEAGPAPHELVELTRISNAYFKYKACFRPKFLDGALAKFSSLVLSVLELAQKASTGLATLSPDQLLGLTALSNSLTKLYPDNVAFPKAAAMVSKIAAVLGAEHMKSKLCSTVSTAFLSLTQDDIKELAREVGLAAGVNLSDYHDKLHAAFNNFFALGGETAIAGLEGSQRRILLENVEEVAVLARMGSWQATWAYFHTQQDAEACIKSWQSLGEFHEVALCQPTGMGQFEGLRRTKAQLDLKQSKLDDPVAPGIKEYLNLTISEKLNALIVEIKQIALAQLDEVLVKTGDALKEKVGVDDMFNRTWDAGCTTFAQLREAHFKLIEGSLKDATVAFSKATCLFPFVFSIIPYWVFGCLVRGCALRAPIQAPKAPYGHSTKQTRLSRRARRPVKIGVATMPSQTIAITTNF